MPKILIVDDDRKIVEMLEIGLNALGYRTVMAYDGEAAIDMVLKEIPDIILLDLNLPKKNGFEVCRQVRMEIKDNYIPIIMITARDDISSKIEGLDTGADDYITKPVDIKEVMARIKSMLRIKSLQDELRTAKDELQELAVRDYLTGCFNRRYFTEILQIELKKSSRYDKSFGCIMLDVDDFKKINDNYGHPFGDEVLKQIADILRDNLRESDIIGRYGGEEFIALLPNISQRVELEQICERIRKKVEKTFFKTDSGNINTTVSIGASLCEGKKSGSNCDDIISNIDKALYKAKWDGKNCCRLI